MRRKPKDDIDFKDLAASGISRDQLLYRLTKVVRKQRAAIGLLSLLLALNFILDILR